MLSKEVVVSSVQQLFAQIKIKIKMEKSYMASRGDYKKAIHIYYVSGETLEKVKSPQYWGFPAEF